jgi:hypothetical protein
MKELAESRIWDNGWGDGGGVQEDVTTLGTQEWGWNREEQTGRDEILQP